MSFHKRDVSTSFVNTNDQVTDVYQISWRFNPRIGYTCSTCSKLDAHMNYMLQI